MKDFSNVFYDMTTVRKEYEGLSDIELYDQCIMDIDYYKREDLDQLYEKLALGFSLTTEERKSLEEFYMLVNLNFMVEE